MMDNENPQENLAKIDQILAHLQGLIYQRWSELITLQLVRLYARLADVLEASDQAAYRLEKLNNEPEISDPGLLYFPLAALEKELLMVMEADEEILNLGGILSLMVREDPDLQNLLENLAIDTRAWTIDITTGLLGKPNASRWPALFEDMQVLSGGRRTDSGSFSIRLPYELARAAADVKLAVVDFGEVDYRDHLDRAIVYFTDRKQLPRIRASREVLEGMILQHMTSEKILASLSPRSKIRSLL